MRILASMIGLFLLTCCGCSGTSGLDVDCTEVFERVEACGGDAMTELDTCEAIERDWDDYSESQRSLAQDRYRCLAALVCVGDADADTRALEDCYGIAPTISVSPIDLSATHQYGTSPCPQVIGTVTVTNNSDVAEDVAVSNPEGIAVSFDPFTVNVGPGESAEITVFFECDPNGINGTVYVGGVAVAVDVNVTGGP